MNNWQPINTAPKDTKAAILLGYLPLPRMAGAPRVYEGRWNDIQNDWTSLNGYLLHTAATHWMPMPSPPESSCEHGCNGCEECTDYDGGDDWHFNRLEPSGTMLAVAPSGQEYVVQHGRMDSEAGRELLNAMTAALSATAKQRI